MELPQLNAIELRILGSLIEKSRTTPAYYPMTLNAIVAACNQKTSRSPVVAYEEHTVKDALNDLKAQSLVATAIGGGSRVVKYKHNFETVFEITPEELTILCILMLRGPQTPGELHTNAARLFEFNSLEEVQAVINSLKSADPPFIKELPKKPGQKEVRFMHLLGGPDHHDSFELEETPAVSAMSDMEMRLAAVETELADLKGIMIKLLQDMEGEKH